MKSFKSSLRDDNGQRENRDKDTNKNDFLSTSDVCTLFVNVVKKQNTLPFWGLSERPV